jgi:uncharacterized protein YdiU (UPF0061 family)
MMWQWFSGLFRSKKAKASLFYRYDFVPQKDITTWELSQCVEFVIGLSVPYSCDDLLRKMFAEFPPEVQRHWREEVVSI